MTRSKAEKQLLNGSLTMSAFSSSRILEVCMLASFTGTVSTIIKGTVNLKIKTTRFSSYLEISAKYSGVNGALNI